MPVVFLGHGGGPMPVLGDKMHKQLIDSWRNLPDLLPFKPRAVCVVSAHWETKFVTVNPGGGDQLLYDYYGFPPETYAPFLTYLSPSAPEQAERTVQLLKAHGFSNVQLDEKRGLDHGVFIPMKFIYPDADMPTFQVSICENLNPMHHIAIGEALAALRDEGVLIIGSGMTFHNLRIWGSPSAREYKEKFETAIFDFLSNSSYDYNQRKQLMSGWDQIPDARKCTGREEHFIPIMVSFGSSRGSPAREICAPNPLSACYLWD